jgi:lipoprotein-releasing system permease protein
LKFAFYIAKRYLFSKRSRNIVHLVSYASILSVLVGTAALVIVLSVFNGFGQLILSLYNSFDPALKISVVEGKTSSFDDVTFTLDQNDILYSHTLEEKVLLRYQDKESIATIKGVDENFHTINKIDSMLVSGNYISNFENNNCVVGQGIAYYLSMGIGDMFDQLQVFVPNREKKSLLAAETAFVQKSLVPVGVFSIQSDFDSEYVLAPISFVRNILNKPLQSSYIEVFCEDDQILELQQQIQYQIGDDYFVENRYQQHAFLYKLLNSEKLIVYFILSFILIIASFNIIGSLSMLMIDKKKDIQTLSNLGASRKMIRNIFLLEGVLTTQIGVIFGVVIGLFVCWLQMEFGLLGMGQGSFVVDSYPVKVEFTDLLIVYITVSVIGIVTSFIPANYMSKKVV